MILETLRLQVTKSLNDHECAPDNSLKLAGTPSLTATPLPILGTEVAMVDSFEAPARTLRALVFAASAVTLLLLLRAKSDGAEPPLLLIGSAFVLLTVLVRPMTARERRWPVVFGVLALTQLSLHVVFLFDSTGRFSHGGSAGLVCSPSAGSGDCLPTERGGLVLLAVQLLAAALFACSMRGAESASWQLARHGLKRLATALRQPALALFSALLVLLPVAAVCLTPQGDSAPRPRLLLFAREHGRRGPPRGRGLPDFFAPFGVGALST
jgi:hypothetical protein